MLCLRLLNGGRRGCMTSITAVAIFLKVRIVTHDIWNIRAGLPTFFGNFNGRYSLLVNLIDFVCCGERYVGFCMRVFFSWVLVNVFFLFVLYLTIWDIFFLFGLKKNYIRNNKLVYFLRFCIPQMWMWMELYTYYSGLMVSFFCLPQLLGVFLKNGDWE